MVSPVIDRRLGLAGNNGAKQPVTVVATTNVTQSGEQTISGIALLASNAADVPDRVLCTAQTDPIYNGVWEVQTGSWVRPDDMNGTGDIVRGTQVRVARGLSAGTTWYMTAADPVVIGTSSQTWSQDPAATETTISYGAITSIIDGVLTQHASLAAAVSAIGSTRCTVVVRDDITMAASASFPATCTVRIENGAQVTTTGYTLTFGAKPQLPPGQCFAGTGTVAFSDGVEGPGFRPQWWGAKADSGTTNNYTAFMSAIAAAETRAAAAGKATLWVEPGAGYFSVSTPIVVNAGGMRVEGGGQIYNPSGNCLQIGDNVSNRSDVQVVGMNLQCSGVGAVAVLVRKAPNVLIRDCTIISYDASGYGIQATDSFCARILGNTFGSIEGYGIHISSNAGGSVIRDNRIDGATTSATCGIYADSAAGLVCTGNTVETWATCINVKAVRGGLFSNYMESYVTGYLFDDGNAEGNTVGGYFAATGSTVSIKASASIGLRIGTSSFVGTHSGGAPIELTTGAGDVEIDGNLIQHDDSYIVKWATNHLALRQHLLRDRSVDDTYGYLAAVTHTGSTGETTVKTYTGVKEHWGVGTQVEVEAAGRITGTAGQKDVRLKLAGTTVATVTEAAGETSDWIIKCTFDINSATVATATVYAFQGAAVEVGDVVQGGGITIDLAATHPAITLTGQLGNSADSIILTRWSVRVIN